MLGKSMPHVQGLKQKRCVWELLVVAAPTSTAGNWWQDRTKRSYKQSADQLSSACAPCPEHTYWGKNWGMKMGGWCSGGGIKRGNVINLDVMFKHEVSKKVLLDHKEFEHGPNVMCPYVRLETTRTSPIKHVAQKEQITCKWMEGQTEREWGRKAASVSERDILHRMPSVLYQHSGRVLQEGGPTYSRAQPQGKGILRGYACWGWVQGGHHQGCAGTLEEEGRIEEGSIRWKVKKNKKIKKIARSGPSALWLAEGKHKQLQRDGQREHWSAMWLT